VSRLSTWTSHLEQLARELEAVHVHRQLWRELSEAIRTEAAQQSSVWLDHYMLLYAIGQSIAVRRVVKSTRGAIALDSTLRSMQKDAEIFRAAATWAPRTLIPAADLARVEAVCLPILPWVNQTLAHLDPRGRPPMGYTWGDLDRAIDTITEVVKDYYQALTGTLRLVDEPVITPLWRRLFARPLFYPPADLPDQP